MGPGQTTPGKSNSTTSLSIGNETEGERHREGDTEREESLHFTEKAFVSSEYFTEMRERERENEKQRIQSFFLSRD